MVVKSLNIFKSQFLHLQKMKPSSTRVVIRIKLNPLCTGETASPIPGMQGTHTMDANLTQFCSSLRFTNTAIKSLTWSELPMQGATDNNVILYFFNPIQSKSNVKVVVILQIKFKMMP